MTLRYYDQIGILRTRKVDHDTCYRYYWIVHGGKFVGQKYFGVLVREGFKGAQSD
ncbi:hypothetical protein D3C76_1859300 [compost metagenome]